jgi:ribosomal protein S18 acetylase RimI-like enzyme
MQQETIAIKRLEIRDAGLLSAVAVRAYSDHYLPLWYDGGQWYLQTYFTQARFEEELQDANAWFFLVTYRNEAVGFMKLNMSKQSPGSNNKALELERIYLTEKASGRGIGTHLLHFTFDIARQHGKKLVWLKVMDSSNGPIRFYKKMGFEICGTHRLSFVQMKEEVRGMYIMQKKL